MKLSCSFFCFLWLSVGACFIPNDGEESSSPKRGFEGIQEQPSLAHVGQMLRWCRWPRHLCSLVSVAEGPQRCREGKGAAQTRFRRRRQMGRNKENEAATEYLLDEDGAKRALSSLAKKLSRCIRRKGGFSFRFGRRKKIAACF